MKSMTSYAAREKAIIARAGAKEYPLTLRCEIKSFNNRHGEYSVALPALFSPHEGAIRSLIAEHMKRGKIYCTIAVSSGEQPVSVSVDEGILAGVRNSLARAGVADLSAALSMIPFNLLFSIIPETLDEGTVALVLALVRETLVDADRMRTVEGENTRRDILRIVGVMNDALGTIRGRAAENTERQLAVLKENLASLLAGRSYDEERMIFEAGLIASKVNINEEIKRLESHFAQISGMLAGDGPMAKELEFLAQELLRETNTIASKAQDIGIIRATLVIKNSIEEMKEQLRNVE